MNHITIIGNVTKDPESRTTQTGLAVCTFTVAVNNKYKPDEEAQFFRVTTWRKLAENCGRYVTKGSKVAVDGKVSLHTYTGNDGQNKASLEVDATDVEFLSSNRSENASPAYEQPAPEPAPDPRVPEGFTNVSGDDELPFDGGLSFP